MSIEVVFGQETTSFHFRMVDVEKGCSACGPDPWMCIISERVEQGLQGEQGPICLALIRCMMGLVSEYMRIQLPKRNPHRWPISSWC